jgi:hypothetical protein
MFGSLLLRECLHSGALAGAQGGVHGGCCQAKGPQGGIFVIAPRFLFTMIVIHVIVGMSVILITLVAISISRLSRSFCRPLSF